MVARLFAAQGHGVKTAGIRTGCLAALLLIAGSGTGARAATAPDARAILEEVAAAERAGGARRAEGVELRELTGEGMNFHTQYRFSGVVEDDRHLRWETIGDPSTLTVCDGAEHWSYTRPGVGFHLSTVEATPCPSPLAPLDGLLENLTEVSVTGTETLPFNGRAVSCTEVRAEYKIPAKRGLGGVAASTIRTLCVDVAAKMVVRDREETAGSGTNARSVRTTTFSAYEREAKIPPGAYLFEAPTGTFLDPGPQAGDDAATTVGDGSHRFGDGVIGPVLVAKTEPQFTGAARQAGVGGLVLVSLTVDAEGMPYNVAVERRLGYGLDEEAVKAVSQWRFRPGLSLGTPVVVRELVVAVDFPRQEPAAAQPR